LLFQDKWVEAWYSQLPEFQGTETKDKSAERGRRRSKIPELTAADVVRGPKAVASTVRRSGFNLTCVSQDDKPKRMAEILLSGKASSPSTTLDIASSLRSAPPDSLDIITRVRSRVLQVRHFSDMSNGLAVSAKRPDSCVCQTVHLALLQEGQKIKAALKGGKEVGGLNNLLENRYERRELTAVPYPS
jgi:hypothetical protein